MITVKGARSRSTLLWPPYLARGAGWRSCLVLVVLRVLAAVIIAVTANSNHLDDSGLR